MSFLTTSPIRRFLTAVVLTAVTVGCSSGNGSVASRPINSLDLANPPEIVSANGVARVAFQAVINPATGGPGIQYAGAFVPPTIRVNPGDTIAITYTNALPPTSAEPLNATNLHFHGLSTSPNPPADDAIDILAMPGQTLHYVVPVPKTEPPGLYWYHSHSHGEANWQLYNGMSGAIVVNGTASFASETAGLPERVIVLRNVLAQPEYSALSLARRAAQQQARKTRAVHTLANDGICHDLPTCEAVPSTMIARARPSLAPQTPSANAPAETRFRSVTTRATTADPDDRRRAGAHRCRDALRSRARTATARR